jgi:hypothetical protein
MRNPLVSSAQRRQRANDRGNSMPKRVHLIFVIALLLTAFIGPADSALAQNSVEDAEARARQIIEDAEREAAEIRREALREAAEIEAEAMRNAAKIEAEAIRKSAQQDAGVPSASPTGEVRVEGDRYPSIDGVWKWEGNARNRKFEITQHEDGTIETELYTSPRTRHYREDLRYADGQLLGRSFQTIRTPTGNDSKRFRDFTLEISRDGNQLVGTITQWDELQNREEREEVVWVRVTD